MIKIKLGELGKILQGMKDLIDKDMSIKIAYKLSKLLKMLDNENQTFEEQRNKLIHKYGKKDDNGELIQHENGGIAIEEETTKQFSFEFSELCNIEIELSFEPLKIDDLGDIKISAMTLFNLSEFIVE